MDAGRDAGGWRRLVPRFSLAAGAVAAPARLCRTLRLRLSDPARRRREAAGRTGRPDLRLHRPARLGRGLSAWRRLGGPGRHFRSANRRGPYPARRDARSTVGRADHRTGGTVQDGIRLRNAREPRARDATGYQAVQRGAVAGHPRDGCRGGSLACRRQCETDDGRRADVRIRHGYRRRRSGIPMRSARPSSGWQSG